MAWWLTVYCRAKVSDLGTDQIEIGLRNGDPEAPAGVDYSALAEEYELPTQAAGDALAQLAVAAVSDESLDYEVRYSSDPEARPIVVHLWDSPARLAEEIEEAIENRDPPESALPRIRAAVQVVGIELGYSQLRGMGLVLACELARYLAQKGDGLFVDDEGEWFAVDEDGDFLDP